MMQLHLRLTLTLSIKSLYKTIFDPQECAYLNITLFQKTESTLPDNTNYKVT